PASFTVATGIGPGAGFGGGDGAFEIDAPVGSLTLTISGPQFQQRTAEASVAAEQATDVGTITVERGRSVSGTVIGPDGAPAAGATVRAGTVLANGPFGDGPGVQTAASGDDGGYTIAGIPAKPLLIAADLDGVGRSTVGHVPGGADSAQIDLQLLGPGSLSRRVTSARPPLAHPP